MQPQRSTEHIRQRRYNLVIGFAAVLILLTAVSLYTIYRLSLANRQLEAIVSVHNEKISAVIDMRTAMRQRQVDLRDMVILPDAFDKDAAWQSYNAAANDFVIARAHLLELGLDDEERLAVDELNTHVQQAYILQQNVIDEVMDNRTQEGIYPLLIKAIENQDRASNMMQRLIDIQRAASRQAMLTARNNYHDTLLVSLSFGAAALILGILVAWLVLRREAAMHAEIVRYHDHLEELVKARTAELQASNQELEAFCYSVSHDLRAPLRGIDGFSDALLEDYGDRLDDAGRRYLERVKLASQRMGELIDDLLDLSRISRRDVNRSPVDLSQLAAEVNHMIRARSKERRVDLDIEPGMIINGDARLLRIALENLFDNAWKFTRNVDKPEIRFYRAHVNGQPAFCVHDNGAGFDMRYVNKLFEVFQRLHGMQEFEGTGIGLVTVRRIIERHGGRVWAESAPGAGARFYFTLH